jgi:hypothetical protein
MLLFSSLCEQIQLIIILIPHIRLIAFEIKPNEYEHPLLLAEARISRSAK